MEEEKSSVSHIGIYGWRKRCLYCLVLLLIMVILLNIALTVWILIVLRFNIEGMGSVRVTGEGLQVQDTAEFLDLVHLESIAAENQLNVQSQGSISINSGEGLSEVAMDSDTITMRSTQFKVELNSDQTTSEATPLLSTTSGSGGGLELRTGSIYLNGSVFDQSVVAKELIGYEQLIIEAGSSVGINAADSFLINSNNGPIDLIAARNITLSTLNGGQITIGAGSVVFEGLPNSLPSSSSNPDHVTYNVCICPSGMLYRVLASPDNTNGCLVDNDLCT